MFRIGIIGCGWIVKKVYLPVIKKMKDAEVSIIFDTDYQKMSNVGMEYQVPNICTNIESFLSASFDAVIIATPNNTHTDYTNLALKAGKHVLCEKPVALSTHDIKYTISIAEANNKIFLPAFVNRFRKDIMQLNELASLVGEVKEVEVNWTRKCGIPRPGTWITNKVIAGGGVLTDIGTHVIDVGLMFLSEKRIKSANLKHGIIEGAALEGAQWNINNESQQFQFDVETWALGEITFINDTILRCNVSWSSEVDEDITSIKVVGTNNTVCLNTLFGFSNNFVRDNIEIYFNGKNGKNEVNIYPMNNTFAFDAFYDLIRCFIDAINGQARNILQPIDGIHVVNVIESLYKSAL